MSDDLSCCRPEKMVNALSWGYVVSPLQYQFYSFKMAVVGMIAVIEIVTVQAFNGKKEVGTNRP